MSGFLRVVGEEVRVDAARQAVAEHRGDDRNQHEHTGSGREAEG